MKRCPASFTFAVAATWVPAVLVAAEDLVLTSDAPEGRIVSPAAGWAAGDRVLVTLGGSSENGQAIHAWDLSLECAGGDFRIHSVEINPAYSVLGGAAALPAERFRALLLRPRAALNDPRADAPPVWLARVELEVLRETAFTSNLAVRARGLSADAWRAAWRASPVRDDDGRRSAEAEADITLMNAPPPAEAESAPELEYLEFPAVVEVQPVGGGLPAAILAAHTEYEVHYLSPYGPAEGYTLFIAGRSGIQRLDSAAPADGAASDLFTLIEGSPPGTPLGPAETGRGFSRYQMVLDDGLIVPDADRDGLEFETPFEGYLCNVTTGGPGPLLLELVLSRMDWEEGRSVELRATAQYAVEE